MVIVAGAVVGGWVAAETMTMSETRVLTHPFFRAIHARAPPSPLLALFRRCPFVCRCPRPNRPSQFVPVCSPGPPESAGQGKGTEDETGTDSTQGLTSAVSNKRPKTALCVHTLPFPPQPPDTALPFPMRARKRPILEPSMLPNMKWTPKPKPQTAGEETSASCCEASGARYGCRQEASRHCG